MPNADSGLCFDFCSNKKLCLDSYLTPMKAPNCIRTKPNCSFLSLPCSFQPDLFCSLSFTVLKCQPLLAPSSVSQSVSWSVIQSASQSVGQYRRSKSRPQHHPCPVHGSLPILITRRDEAIVFTVNLAEKPETEVNPPDRVRWKMD